MPLLSLIAIFASSPIFQDTPTKEDLHGKSAEQIVKMGHEKWYDFYIGREGESTMSMSFCETYYGWAMRTVNNKTVFSQSMDEQNRITHLRDNMEKFAYSCIEVGRAYSGGGTLWNPVYAGVVGDVEEAVAVYLDLTKDKKSAIQSQVWSALKKGSADLKEAEGDIRDGEQFSNIKFEDVNKSMADAYVLFNSALPQLERVSTAKKARFFAFYKSWAEVLHAFE